MDEYFDIIDLYKKGYSISYIINHYYSYKTKFDKPVKFENGNIIIFLKSITKSDAKNFVYEHIYNNLHEGS